MERPMCPLCRSRHYAREPHDFKDAKVVVARQIASQVVEKVADGVPVKFDRVGYQREYMRVWRAVKAGRACLLKT